MTDEHLAEIRLPASREARQVTDDMVERAARALVSDLWFGLRWDDATEQLRDLTRESVRRALAAAHEAGKL